MHVGFVVYDGLDERSGGYRYDRKLVEYLRACGDRVDVIPITRTSYVGNLGHNFSVSLRARLDRPFDVLLQDELCHPSLVRLNAHLDDPTAVVTLVHLLASIAPETRLQWLSRIVEPRYLRGVNAALCTSQDTARRLDTITSVPSTVAYPGGRRERAALAPDTVTERAHSGQLRIVFLGSAIERKGLSTLVDALSGLDGEWTATIVGRLDIDSRYVSRVKRTIVDSNLVHHVDLRGVVGDDELERILERSHVLAVPSRYESFGMAYLEAMEYGVVPIATRVGGPAEFVVDGTNGILVGPNNPGALRAHLATLRDDREHLASLARGALETADDHPTWSESMATARTFLKGCVEQSSSSTSRRRSERAGGQT